MWELISGNSTAFPEPWQLSWKARPACPPAFRAKGLPFFLSPVPPMVSCFLILPSMTLCLSQEPRGEVRLFCQQSHSDRPTHYGGQANHISHKRPTSLATLFLESRSWVLFISGQLPSLVLPVKVKNKRHTHAHTHRNQTTKTQCLFMHVMR